jgi:hypothetical protein
VRHGEDTVATERFTRRDTNIEGVLAIHNSRNTSQRYTAVIAPDATVPMIDVAVREDSDSGRVKQKLVQRARVIFREDSAAVDAVISQNIEDPGVRHGARGDSLPEHVVRAAGAGGCVAAGYRAPPPTRLPFFNLGGGQTVSAKVQRVGSDSLALDIGKVEYRLRVDRTGRVLGGAIPSQNVFVERR